MPQTRKRSRRSTKLTAASEGSADNIVLLQNQSMDFEGDPESDDYYNELDNAVCGTLFNPHMIAYIIRMMSLEVDIGRAQGGAFNKTTWPRIHRKFNRFFKVDYTIEQITAKYHRIKRDYQTFKYLLAHTGFGWNEALKVPCAPEETWERVSRCRKNCLKFKTQTLPQYDMLHKIFGGTTATGAFSCNSTQRPFTDQEEATIQAGFETPPQVVHESHLSQEDMSTSSQHTGQRNGKAPATGQPKSAKANKKGRSDVYNSDMQAISESSVWRGEKDKAMTKAYDRVLPFCTPSPATSDPESIMPILLRLKANSEIDSFTFANACANLEGLYHRRMFVAMKDDARIAWMKFLTRGGQNSDRVNSRGGLGVGAGGSGASN